MHLLALSQVTNRGEGTVSDNELRLNLSLNESELRAQQSDRVVTIE